MKAITLWPEWVWAILHLGKRVENRGWAIPTGNVGAPVAIHAGKYVGGRPGFSATRDAITGLVEMATRAGWEHERWVSGGITVLSFTNKDGRTIRTDETPILTSSIVGIAHFGLSYTPGNGPLEGWRVPDQHGWPLRVFSPLTSPVECKGAQGFWTVPEDVRAKMEWSNG